MKNGWISSLVLAASVAAVHGQSSQITWTFDNLKAIGGLPVRVDGNPQIIDSPVGKAIQFDGVKDEIFIDKHPLAGATTFTFEAIFRPDGGAEEQRWFHLAERDPKTGLLANEGASTNDANARFLFEIRVEGDQWYLDAFVNGGPGFSRTLMIKEKLHPIGQWYHVAQVYDGKMYRSYVNGELQGEGELNYKPQGEGGAAIGARMNKVTFFHGAVAKARFTPSALQPADFMKLK